MSVSGAPSTARLRRVGSDGCDDAWVEPGQIANVPVTFIEDRNGRALVRLPNGSKTSVQYNALTAERARGHFVSSQDRRTVTIYCLERDWEATEVSWGVAAQELLQHWRAQHDASGAYGS